jgi:hypothetical protein
MRAEVKALSFTMNCNIQNNGTIFHPFCFPLKSVVCNVMKKLDTRVKKVLRFKILKHEFPNNYFHFAEHFFK